MSYTLDDLLGLLDLEELEQNIFRGRTRDIGSGSVFGGQVLAQALVAAGRTVDADRLRDGRSFTTRRVTAIQHGRAIFNMAASFHYPEDGPEHQILMPEVPGPEGLPRELDLIRSVADRIPEPLRAIYTQERPIEFRPVDPIDPFRPDRRPPLKHVWLRAVGAVLGHTLQHQGVLAYASDYGLLGTVLLPHGLSFQQRHLQAATLDHALWFHRPFRVDEWLLYTTDSPITGGARGFTRGSIFAQDGTLVASVVQEGLLRVRKEQKG